MEVVVQKEKTRENFKIRRDSSYFNAVAFLQVFTKYLLDDHIKEGIVPGF